VKEPVLKEDESCRGFYCHECGAEGEVVYDLEDDYEPLFCAFCGVTLEQDNDRDEQFMEEFEKTVQEFSDEE